VREAIESVGAKVLYLPSYSPDFNPIEMAFSKFKRLLKIAKERTVEALWQTCGRLLDQFQEIECRNYFRQCGYRYT
jgi:transposase